MPYQRYNQACKGFTLIEVLVVIVIIGIISTVALLSFGDFGQRRKEILTLTQIKNHIQAARQQAILTNNLLGLKFKQHSFAFYQYRNNQWQPLPNYALSTIQSLPRDTRLQVITHSDTSHKNKPTIVFFPNGTITPFTLHIHFGRKSYDVLQVERNSEVSIEKH